MKIKLCLTFLLFCFLAACGDSGPLNKARYSSALSKLRKYSTVNYIRYMEQMMFAPNLSVLYDEGYIDSEFFEAWDQNTDPVPYNGYLFADVVNVDPRRRSGLCAYPAEPGGKLLLILLDPELEQRTGGGEDGFAGQGGFSSSGGFMILEADYDQTGGPVRQWPSEEEISLLYKNLTLTVGQGVKKARGLY